MEDFKDLQDPQIAEQSNELTFEVKSLLQADKAVITDISKHLVARIANGELDPVRAFLHNKKILELATLNDKNFRPYFNDHARVGKGETLVQYNVKITQAETGVHYDYSACEDLTYNSIMEEFERISALKKEREEFLKTIKKETGAFDPETSESWVIKPPIKSGTLGFKTELK